jgi:subtilisin family serine protease
MRQAVSLESASLESAPLESAPLESTVPESAMTWPAGVMTGRGVRVAIIDSGVFAAHPHVGGVAGGVAIEEDGQEAADYVDRLGHGTAVTAAIKEKAPDAALYAVRVFDHTLVTSLPRLLRAIDWAVRADMHVVNLSLGTRRPEHAPALADAVEQAARRGVVIVSAEQDEDGVRWLPGSLPGPGVIGVRVDWACARDEYRVDLPDTAETGAEIGAETRAGTGAAAVAAGPIFRASGYPRPIPGVPPARNLNGISFAVANMTAFVARAIEASPGASSEQLTRLLAERPVHIVGSGSID